MTGVQTCALPISAASPGACGAGGRATGAGLGNGLRRISVGRSETAGAGAEAAVAAAGIEGAAGAGGAVTAGGAAAAGGAIGLRISVGRSAKGAGVEGAEASGPYVVDSAGHTFTAPESISVPGGGSYTLDGYTLVSTYPTDRWGSRAVLVYRRGP